MSSRYFIYVRKSTDDTSRQVRSIDDQIAELRDLAGRESLSVVEVLAEKQTAKKPGRPVFNAMLDRIERGEADGILAWHPDRLSRNSLDSGRIIYMVDGGTIKALRFCTQTFEPTAQGKFNLAIMFDQAKYYVDSLSENIRRGQRQKLKNGLWPTVAPVGYLNDRILRTIYPDPVRGPLVRKAFELHAGGSYTLDRLAEAVNGLGLTARTGQPLSRAQYHRILRNPIYCGAIRYGGELHEARHEPLVTRQLFDQVQAVMGRKAKPKAPKLKPYLYRGIFACGECGCFITTETQKGHNYLRCTKRVKRDCSQPFVREEQVAEQIGSALRFLRVPADWTEWMAAELRAEQRREDEAVSGLASEARAALARLAAKGDRLTQAYLDGDLSADEFRGAKAKLVEEKQLANDRLARLEQNPKKRFEPVTRFVKSLSEATLCAESGKEAEKRDWFRKVGSNPILRNRELTWKPRGAWQTVADHGPFARPNAAPVPGAAGCVGETDQIAQKRRGRDAN